MTATKEQKKRYYIKHREDVRRYQREYYIRNRDARLAAAAEYRKAHPTANSDYYRAHRAEILSRESDFLQSIRDRKRELGCADCGQTEGWLDYHHVDPNTKEYDVATMHFASDEKVESEIAKCVVLCRKCHRRRHRELKFKGAAE